MKKRKISYSKFARENPDLIPADFSVDVTRDWLPSSARREKLLEVIRATVPDLTERQKQVLGLLSQGNSMEEVAAELKITKSAVFDIIVIIRKKVCYNLPDKWPVEGLE